MPFYQNHSRMGKGADIDKLIKNPFGSLNVREASRNFWKRTIMKWAFSATYQIIV